MKKFKIIILWSTLTLSCLLVVMAYTVYRFVFAPAVVIGDREFVYVYIPTGSEFNTVKGIIHGMDIIRNLDVFEKVAELKKYNTHIKSGRYKVDQGMSINALVNLLRSGKQDPVRLVFNNIRTPQQLAGRISQQIEADSLSLLHCFTDSILLATYGVRPNEVAMLFIPNTYEFYWNTNAESFIKRMHLETEKFWNQSRIESLIRTSMTKKKVVTLASIVEMETQQTGEKQRVAGVYMNRLRIGMPLQADPTLVFAHGDFTIRRVLNFHKEIDSPYNTYKYLGLPPGPICFPSIASIDAVLNFENHEYLYFCARDDFSGYHAFARTYPEHLQNARRYQRALNQLNINK